MTFHSKGLYIHGEGYPVRVFFFFFFFFYLTLPPLFARALDETKALGGPCTSGISGAAKAPIATAATFLGTTDFKVTHTITMKFALLVMRLVVIGILHESKREFTKKKINFQSKAEFENIIYVDQWFNLTSAHQSMGKLIFISGSQNNAMNYHIIIYNYWPTPFWLSSLS